MYVYVKYILCSLSASFYGDGFVQLKVKESTQLNTLRVRFRTSSQRGVLFLAAGQSDYLLLELSSGRLQASHVHVYHHVIQCVRLTTVHSLKCTRQFLSAQRYLIGSAVEVKTTIDIYAKLSEMMLECNHNSADFFK